MRRTTLTVLLFLCAAQAFAQHVRVNGVSTATAAATSPGGSTTQVQFNDAGSFGGDADLTWNKTSNQLTFGANSEIRIGASGTILEGPSAHTLYQATAPTISSGFGGTPSIVASNGTAAFTINVGTGGVATSGVIGLPSTASNGWSCDCRDLTTQSATVYLCKQTATTASTATIGNFDAAGAAAAWVASDVLSVTCWAY